MSADGKSQDSIRAGLPSSNGPSASTPSANTPSPDTPASSVQEVPILNIANILTMLRIALVPVFLIVLFVGDGHESGWRIGAAAVFVIAALTDRIDGQLARKLGLTTDFGRIADPIADKALIGAALVGLSVLGDLSWWVTGIIAFRELSVTVLRIVVIRHRVIPASRGGKLKTLVQVAAIFLLILPLPAFLDTSLVVLIWIAVALTVATGLDYVVQAFALRRDKHPSLASSEDKPN